MSSTPIPAHRLVPGDEFFYGGTWHTVISISGASHGRLHIRCGPESFVADPSALRHTRPSLPAPVADVETEQ